MCEVKNFSLSGSSMNSEALGREDKCKYAIVIVGEDDYEFNEFIMRFCDIYWYDEYDQLEIDDLKEFYEIVMVVV